MKRVLCLAILLCSPALLAQASPPQEKPQGAPTQAAPPPSAGPKGFVLEDATPVKLRINRTVSSADAKEGDTIDFDVLEDVQVNGVLVVPKGGWLLPPSPKRKTSAVWAAAGNLTSISTTFDCSTTKEPLFGRLRRSKVEAIPPR